VKWLELKVPPLLAWLLTACAMWGLSWSMPALTVAVPARMAIGLALFLLGVALAAAGARGLRRGGTTVNPLTPGQSSAIVSTGIYARSRNPIYLGMLVALCGWALYLGHAIAVLLLPAFALYISRFQIEPEERALRGKFGPEFDCYSARVRRWL
jgi:protein-S-isoprenylcysteine O-methyltransferase Ste14